MAGGEPATKSIEDCIAFCDIKGRRPKPTTGTRQASSAGAAIHDIFAEGELYGSQYSRWNELSGGFPLLIDRLDGPVMLVGRLDVSVIRSPRGPFEPQARAVAEKEETKRRAITHLLIVGSPCRERAKQKWPGPKLPPQ